MRASRLEAIDHRETHTVTLREKCAKSRDMMTVKQAFDLIWAIRPMSKLECMIRRIEGPCHCLTRRS